MRSVSRRAALAVPAAAVLAAPAVALPHPDAELMDACRAYIAASQDYDAHGGYLDYEVCPWWAAVGAAATRAESYEPRTMAGVRAMAEVAAHLARQPDGELDWSDSFTGAWPARVCQAVLRLTA